MDPSFAIKAVMVGGFGTEYGIVVAELETFEYPLALIALIYTVYVVPFTRLETRYNVLVDPILINVPDGPVIEYA